MIRVLVAVLLLGLPAVAQKPAPADVIYVGGKVYRGSGAKVNIEVSAKPSGDELVKKMTAALNPTAIAVRDGRIVAVGSDDEIRKLKGKRTQVVEVKGAFVIPGFNDAHVHLASGGFEKLNVNLTGTKSLEEMKKRIAERAKATPAGEWITGRGWDHTKWTEQKLPSRQDLDAVTGDHPAIFTRVDGHISVANSAALKAAGISRDSKAPEGGTIDKDESGEPTGILRETADDTVRAKIPPPTPSQRRRAIELALADAAQWGVTSAQDNSDWADFLVYEELQREGKLTLRITEWLPFRGPLPRLQQHRAHHNDKDPLLHTGLLKGVMDGTLGSRTAAMLQPYADDPKNTGLPQYSQDELNKLVAEQVLSGFQFGFHAIGDAAAEMALQAFAYAQNEYRRTNGGGRGETQRDFRHRIEHAQVLAPGHYQRMKELGVIASMQPNHLLTDMNWAESRIGAERAKLSYPWRSMLKHGIPLAFGTDYPVEPITPFRGLYAAVTRKNEAGTAEYVPEEKLTIQEAIAAYTAGSAYAEFAESEKGWLSPGMLADFVVLDRDITKVAPEEILKTRVLRTVVGGKTVYEAAAR
jgi:predicted amidohydrolase YtcJ